MTPVGPLDQHDVGASVSQELGAVRAGDPAFRQIDDAQTQNSTGSESIPRTNAPGTHDTRVPVPTWMSGNGE